MAKILIDCLDEVNESMAGPAIRSWEFASHLSIKNDVVLLIPNESKLKSNKFTILTKKKNVLAEQIEKADYLISQTIRPKTAKIAKKYNTKVIIDAYDPITIEALESEKDKEIGLRKAINKILLLEQSFSFTFANYVICASEKQRDFWLGVLSSMNRLTPTAYDKDNSFRSFIDVVPFGLSKKTPQKNDSESLRGKFNLKKDDFVLLWGGGIWNWFDPLSLIKAVSLVDKDVPVKLVFMGIDHPNKNIKRMEMVSKAMLLSDKLGLTNKSIFFNEGWVPYKERQQYLLDADVGVSMHFDHLETRFSFRTRILDYIWASLPIIATQGDSFAELIEEKKLGVVVEYENSQSICDAIKELYSNKDLYASSKQNLKNIQKDFYWDNCILPIDNIINTPTHNANSTLLNVTEASINLTNLYRAQKIASRKFIRKVLNKFYINKH